jgi:alkylhydroperoxidase/carboxymuconolactone decarboxylase family protein YurZ
MRLRGDTLRSAGAATGIRAANLSVWLRGKEQVISAKRVAGLIYHLGIEGGRLRNDVLHCWCDAGQLDDIQAVLGAVTGGGDAIWLFQDGQPGLTKVRFLRVGEAWVRAEISRGAGAGRDITEGVAMQRVVTLPTSLAGIPTGSPQEASNALMTLAEQAATDVGDDELLDRLMHLLPDDIGAELCANIASPQGWQQLETALRAALRNGVTPADIAALIAANYRNGGNAAHGRNPVST